MNNNTSEVKKKVCTSCGKELLANLENFNKESKGKYGLMSKCKPCMQKIRDSKKEEKRLYDEKYREINRERINKRVNEYAKTHREQKNKYDKQRRQGKDRERILEKKRIYHQKIKSDPEYIEKRRMYYDQNKDKILKRCSKWYSEHKEYVRERSQKWREKNRDKDTTSKQRYKARKEKLDSTLTAEQWIEIKNHFDNKCAYCGKSKPLAQEHFLPVKKGGEYTHNNIVPSCSSCNSSKGPKDFFVWYPNYKYYSKTRERKILKFLGYENKVQQLSIL